MNVFSTAASSLRACGRSIGLFLLGALGIATVPVAAQATDTNWSLGVEYFHDRYREPGTDLDVTDTTDYGSITGHVDRTGKKLFVAFDGRVSYGTDSYNSVSGSASGAPQYDTDWRARVGGICHMWGGTISPYAGLGLRYFEDEGKGEETNLGFFGYDRRITQLYVPIGATYSYMTAGGWTVAPNLEVDPLVWGNVNTRLQNLGGPNLNNTQHSGYGLRGDLMFGKDFGGLAWQFGPFIRFWDVEESDPVPVGGGFVAFEPHNTRTQAGVALRALW